jgi:hypothetical protein
VGSVARVRVAGGWGSERQEAGPPEPWGGWGGGQTAQRPPQTTARHTPRAAATGRTLRTRPAGPPRGLEWGTCKQKQGGGHPPRAVRRSARASPGPPAPPKPTPRVTRQRVRPPSRERGGLGGWSGLPKAGSPQQQGGATGTPSSRKRSRNAQNHPSPPQTSAPEVPPPCRSVAQAALRPGGGAQGLKGGVLDQITATSAMRGAKMAPRMWLPPCAGCPRPPRCCANRAEGCAGPRGRCAEPGVRVSQIRSDTQPLGTLGLLRAAAQQAQWMRHHSPPAAAKESRRSSGGRARQGLKGGPRGGGGWISLTHAHAHPQTSPTLLPTPARRQRTARTCG